MTTTNLRLPRQRWRDLPTPITASIAVFALLLVAFAIGRLRSAPGAAAEPTLATTSAPIIMIATARPTPPAPTPDMALRAELEQLRARIAELEQRAAAPATIAQPIIAPVAAPPVEAPEQPYTVANEPEVAEPQVADARQANIQDHYANAHIDAAPAPTAAPEVAVTPSLEEALAHADTQPQIGDRWREEHCFGDVCH